MKKELNKIKNNIINKYFYIIALIFTFIPSEVLAEDRRVNTKYFGSDQKFWSDIKTWYAWFMGFMWLVTILMVWIAMAKASSQTAKAKMSGNSSEFYRGAKNYSQLVFNIAAALIFLSFLATIMGAYIFMR